MAQIDKQSEEYRVALFLYSIGTEAVKTYNSFDMTDENRKNLAEIIKELTDMLLEKRMKRMKDTSSTAGTSKRVKALTNMWRS